MNIHPTAIVSKQAKIAEDVEIGPYAIIEDDVEIGPKVKIYSHAQVLKNTTIGENCQIHMGAVLGHLPQIRQGRDGAGRLIIGKANIFREYATVHCSSKKETATVIGDDNYFMAFSHVAHDCNIGNHVTICNGALLAGHVLVEDYAFISGNVTVHQFCRIGKLAIIGGLARVAKDVPPYMLLKGDSIIWAINSVGLKRANLSLAVRSEIKKAFKLLYTSGLNVKQASEQLQKETNTAEVCHLINFIQQSARGICGYKTVSFWEKMRLNLSTANTKPMSAYRLFLTNRKAQELLAMSLVFTFLVIIFIFVNRFVKTKTQNAHQDLIKDMKKVFSTF